MNSVGGSAAKSARDLAIAAAKQMAREPLEVLKTAKEQTTGTAEAPRGPEAPKPAQAEAQPQQQSEQQKEMAKMKVERRMEALNRELEDIRKQDLFKDLQEKISQGEQIMLEEYPELTREQKEVLKAQMQAVRDQMAARQAQAGEALPMPSSKPSRRMGGPTKKQEAEKQQQRVEKPVPPSG